MLARYKMYRGSRPAEDPLPEGIRKDVRRHQNHCLSPTKEMVEKYLENPTLQAWKVYEKGYMKLLRRNFRERRDDFDKLADLAMKQDVYIGCSCPTTTNPDIYRCHTVLALKFMKQKYPNLTVAFPGQSSE